MTLGLDLAILSLGVVTIDKRDDRHLSVHGEHCVRTALEKESDVRDSVRLEKQTHCARRRLSLDGLDHILEQ
jgi:hypothetical protein